MDVEREAIIMDALPVMHGILSGHACTLHASLVANYPLKLKIMWRHLHTN